MPLCLWLRPPLPVQDWEEGDGDYVAPELLQAGGEPSERADIFSLGASLYECATGAPRLGWLGRWTDMERGRELRRLACCRPPCLPGCLPC